MREKIFNLKKPWVAGMLLVMITLMFGPYNYHILTWWGVGYYLLCWGLFLLGLSMTRISFILIKGAIKNQSKQSCIALHKWHKENRLSKKGAYFIVVLSILTIVAAGLYVIVILRQAGGFLTIGGGDYRYLVTEVRDNTTRFLELIMWCGTPAYLFATYSRSSFTGKQMLVIDIAYWMVPLFYLMLGARFSVFYHMIVFFVNRGVLKHFKQGEKGRKRAVLFNSKQLMLHIISAIGIMAMLFVVFRLFAVRRPQALNTLHFFSDGDMTIRPIWLWILQASEGSITPVYGIFHYFAHSVPNLCYLLSNLDESCIHLFGLFNFTAIRYVLIALGVSDDWAKTIILSYPGSGGYQTFIVPCIVDFGVWFTPIMCIALGYMFSRVEKMAVKNNILAITAYPICWACMLNGSIIGIWVSSSQMNLIILFFIFVCLKYFGGFNHTRGGYPNRNEREELP